MRTRVRSGKETMRSPAFAATTVTSVSSTPALGSKRCTNKVPMRRRNGPATACPASSPLATEESSPGTVADSAAPSQ